MAVLTILMTGAAVGRGPELVMKSDNGMGGDAALRYLVREVAAGYRDHVRGLGRRDPQEVAQRLIRQVRALAELGLGLDLEE